MQRFTRILILTLSLAFTLSISAQDGTGADDPLAGDASIESLSPAERVSRATRSIDKMKSVRDSGQKLLERTRKEDRDIIKLNCINEKLSAVKGFLKVGEQAYVELQEEIDEKNEQGQIHQSKLISLAESRVLPLGDEMQACAGDIIQYTGPTNLDVTIDEDVRTDNPTSGEPFEPFEDLNRLDDISPYQ